MADARCAAQQRHRLDDDLAHPRNLVGGRGAPSGFVGRQLHGAMMVQTPR